MNNEKVVLKKKLCSLLSLCKRSGNLVSGESKSINTIRSKKAKIVILSNFASNNTKKKFSNSAHYYNVPLYILDIDKYEMGKIIGESERSVIAITGDDFMIEIEKYIKKLEYSGGGPIV